MNQLNSIPNKPHHQKSDSDSPRNLQKFYPGLAAIYRITGPCNGDMRTSLGGLCAPIQKEYAIFNELSRDIQEFFDLIRHCWYLKSRCFVQLPVALGIVFRTVGRPCADPRLDISAQTTPERFKI